MIKTIYIPDIVGRIAERVDVALQKSKGIAVQYDWGDIDHIKTTLIEKDQSPNIPKKYPLIWLVTPFMEDHDEERHPGVYTQVDLFFIIAHDTELGYSMKERRDKVFKPILYPVMQELVKQLTNSGGLFTAAPLIYRKRDVQLARRNDQRTESGKLLFNDAADIIELELKNVLINNNYC